MDRLDNLMNDKEKMDMFINRARIRLKNEEKDKRSYVKYLDEYQKAKEDPEQEKEEALKALMKIIRNTG